MATEKISAMTYLAVAVGDILYGVRESLSTPKRRQFLAEDISNLNLGIASERTKQHNFNAAVLIGLGADFAINGGMVTDTGWTKGVGWTLPGSIATSDGSQSGDSDLENDTVAPVAGKTYEIVIVTANRTVGNLTPVIGAQEGTDRAGNTTYTELIVATNTDVLKLRADLDWDGDVDDVTIRLANVSWDLDDNEVCSLTLDQNLVIDDPTNMVDGGIYTLHLLQDGTGTRIPTWGSAFKWPGGTIPTLTTTATTGHDVFRFSSDGTSMFLISSVLDLQ